MTQKEIEKIAYAVYPERRCPNLSNTGLFDGNGQKREGYIKALTDMKYVDMKSPFTGGRVTLETKDQEIEYRGQKVKITQKYYRCEDTGNEFTDTKLDNDMMWDVFRAYWDKKNPEHFRDIDLYDAPKIKGWVSRDSVEDGFIGTGLIFHLSKPSRCTREWSSQSIAMYLPWEMFPNLKWEDEPIEVELVIRKV